MSIKYDMTTYSDYEIMTIQVDDAIYVNLFKSNGFILSMPPVHPSHHTCPVS